MPGYESPTHYIGNAAASVRHEANFQERAKDALRRINLRRRFMNELGIRSRFIADSSPPASMDGRSNPGVCQREKGGCAYEAPPHTTVLTVAVVMIIMVALAMPLLADSTKER
jgi:hypothetical protein